ncbi:MAG: hypothetical protein Roseis2KO_60660 [Roseivirga sp.]
MKILVLLLCLIGLSACTKGDASEEVDKAGVTKEVEARLKAFATAINAGDVAVLPNFYSQSERFYWVEDGKVTYPDHATLAASLEGLLTSLESTEMRVLSSRVEVLANNRASIYSEYEQDLKMKGGYEFSINGAMTVLMEKEEGVWRYVIGHSSTKKER